MRRDVHTFIAARWSLIDGGPGTNLARETRSRLGFSPAYGFTAVGGVHYRTERGRAILFTLPPDPSDGLIGMAKSLIGSKYSAEVEVVSKDDLPASVESAKKKLAPRPSACLWPSQDRIRDHLPVVLEYQSGGFVHACLLKGFYVWSPPAYSLEDAGVFDDAEEANDWLDQRDFHEPVVLRYLAAAQAEVDQRDRLFSP